MLEYNDIFSTVLETGDHGSFNSWGRDRYWHPNRGYMDSAAAVQPGMILLDAQKTTIIRNNILRCDHGWDIDLDDGSSNYYIYNNICLNGGLKLREGFYRRVENNILINNTFHPHVWFKNSGDSFKHNIVTTPYAPIGITNPPSASIDSNFFAPPKGLADAHAMGTDANSLAGDPLFANADKGDYRLPANSPALKIGFKNIDYQSAGVKSPRLKALAKATPYPSFILPKAGAEGKQEYTWLGATLKNIEGLGERSASGLPDEDGVIILDRGKGLLARSALQNRDVIRKVAGTDVKEYIDLLVEIRKHEWTCKVTLTIFRNQQEIPVELALK